MNILSGVKIVEIAGIGPGPFCAMHLADLGAEVITVQRPDGRAGSLGPETCINRGKRAIALDLKSEEGREAVLRLVDGADALIEGMRPGVIERLGLGPQACRARNPRLVFGRMTGWGQSGPLAQMAAHDANYISLSGALWNASPAGQAPVTPFSVVGDIAGGALYLAIGILSGILNARSTGVGCVVDASVVDGSAHSLHLLLAAKARGLISEKRGRSIHDASPFYATYRCADGGYLTAGAIEPQFYRVMLAKLDLANDPDFERQWDRDRWPELKERLQAVFATRTRDEWEKVFEGSDACIAPVLSPEEAARHPHNVARETYFEREGFLQAVPSPRFDDRVCVPGPIPRHGQHTDEILAKLHGDEPESAWKSRV
ncbi:CaiB/BaiF CoA-transferase family protein [Variovorax robiniae]|uniref:CaiB/BaiF CoA-transferase family protein n=1 Tax=Variovorax robiniae TaxID=1836199 RepID=A0ABU8XFY6_9BURK